MSIRRPSYVIGVVLLALIMSIPQMCLGAIAWYVVYEVRAGFVTTFPFLIGDGKDWLYPPEHVPFWHDRFVKFHFNEVQLGRKVTLLAISPETGGESEFDVTVPKPRDHISFGSRLLVKQDPDDWSEVLDGQLQPIEFTLPNLGVRNPEYFLLNGELACAVKANDRFTVYGFSHGDWNEFGDVIVPRESDRSGTIQPDDHLQCLNQGDRVHQFLYLTGRIYHREGMKLALKQEGNVDVVITSGNKDEIPAGPAAPHAVQQVEQLAGWSLVTPFTLPRTPNYNFISRPHWGIGVGGRPAVILIDGIDSRTAVGHIYRSDGTKWTESMSVNFPFGAVSFRAVTSADWQRSYVVVTTATGRMIVYAIEETGVRVTGLSNPGLKTESETLRFIGGLPAVMLAAGLLLGLAIWPLMAWFTRPEYEFGVQAVNLASLGWRGFARVIDLGLLGFTTVGLGWLVTLGFEWQSLAEALHLRVEHPTVFIVRRVAVILIAWGLFYVVTALLAQAVWGVTPGKWLCGLRTVRTTLRPCGFARSLAREVVFFVDCCNGLCWTPGIVSIAFTDRRQRLGDLVADTIVVESGSLAPVSKPKSLVSRKNQPLIERDTESVDA